MRLLIRVFMAVLVTAIAVPAAAQSPNTSTIVVVVLDQTDALVKDAKITVANAATGLVREVVSGDRGSATIAALPLMGSYKVTVSKQGFTAESIDAVMLRAAETVTLKIKLKVAGEKSEVVVYGSAQGVRSDAQIGRSLDSMTIDETPILGRKTTSLPLLNSAFRQGKGTGDLFVNQTYFITGAGSRRTTTVTLDGANNDEGWGRQTMIATVPIGAIQEMAVLTNAFNAEYGWTAGPALNIVTKSGTNSIRGEGLFMSRPGGMQSKSFSTKGFCPPTVTTCTTPSTLQAVNAVDVPDELAQVSGSIGGAIKTDKTFFFATADYTRQDRTTTLSPALPAFVLLGHEDLKYTGNYRQELLNARVDHKLTAGQDLMFRFNFDSFFDNNPQDAVSGTSAPTTARRYSRQSWTMQANHTAVVSPRLLNEMRVAYLNGDPVTSWESIGDPTTTYTRGGNNAPFTIGQSRAASLFGHQAQISDTVSWSRGRHYMRFGGSAVHHVSGGTGNEPGTAILGTFTFVTSGASATLPFDQLTLNDVQSYSQPITFGNDRYELSQWLSALYVQDSYRVSNDLTLDLGLRYDRQTFTTATKNFAPRVGFGWHPGGDSRLAIRGGYGMYYTQIRSNAVAGFLLNGLEGFITYTATPGQTGFPTCLVGACLPVTFDPRTLPLSQLPARDITLIAGKREFYEEQFARFGYDFSKVPNYPDTFVNPRSQVVSIGAEREVRKGLFVGADYVHQLWTDLDRTVDLNAPSTFDRTTPNQTRTVAAANATRPIVPANGGLRNINTLMNLGEADYNGLQTTIIYRGQPKLYASLSYTLSKATNTTEPDGNGIGPNQNNIDRLNEQERGPSVVDQRHRAVITLTYQLPYNITAGTVTFLASGRPFNSTTGADNNGDGASNDRPVVNGQVVNKSAFRGTGTQDFSVFLEGRIKSSGRTILLRVEGFNLLNHGNFLGRGVTVFGNTSDVAAESFGRFVGVGTETNAIPAFANIDPPRMVQFQIRFLF